MIGLTIQNRGAFLKMATDAAALDGDIKTAVREVSREFQGIARSELSSRRSGTLYGARMGRARYRGVRRRVQLFGGKTGTVLRREQMKKSGTAAYRGSRPGEPPGVFTGTLLRSLRVSFPSKGKGYSGRVFAHSKIAPHRHLLEFGTGRFVIGNSRKSKRGAAKTHRMPRPFWTPLQKRAMAALEQRILAVINASAAFRG